MSHDATLIDMGISRTQSSRWQKKALIPDDEFEALIRETLAAMKELTSELVRKLGRNTQLIATDADRLIMRV